MRKEFTTQYNYILSRMHSCSEPGCKACQEDRNALDKLMQLVHADSYERGVLDGLSRVQVRPGFGDMGG
jgi:hypothetical protein